MHMKKTIICLLAIPCLALSCIKDKGNTDYTVVNDVDVSLPAEVSTLMEAKTVTITPELSQTLSKNKDNLEFEWLRSYINFNVAGVSDTEVIGNSETLSIELTGAERKYVQYIRLNVHDKITGLTYPANVLLRLIKPYTGAWMVLHGNAAGEARLGAIEYVGEPTVTPDAYHKETGRQFTGAPVSLLGVPGMLYFAVGGGYDTKVFGIVTDNPDESGTFIPSDQFRQVQKLKLNQLVSPLADATFDYSSFRAAPGHGTDHGFTIISGGRLYHCPVGVKIYKVHTGTLGGLNITHNTKFGFLSLVYDQAARRFLTYYRTALTTIATVAFDEAWDNPASAVLKSIPLKEINATGADPNALPEGRQVLYLGPGLKYSTENSNSTYAYALAKEGAMCYVYEFNSLGFTTGNIPTFSGFTAVAAPAGLDANSCFATTDVFSGLIYFTSGSTVYRWDFRAEGGAVTPIYTNENGGTAVKMTFARSATDSRMEPGGVLSFPEYEFDPMYSLAVCFNLPDGTGEVAVINLSSSGRPGNDSKHFPAVQTHRGFGPITDIVFY